MAGVIAAALLECVHCAIWDFQRKRRILHEARANSSKKGCVDAIEMGRRIEESPLAFIVDVITFTEFKPMFPWCVILNI